MMKEMPHPVSDPSLIVPHVVNDALDASPHEPADPHHSLAESRNGCRIDVRTTARDSFIEYHITARVEGPAAHGTAADELLGQVAHILTERRVQPIQEKLYGFTGVRAEVLRRREMIYRHHELDVRVPVTWIQGTPLDECAFAGLQIWGIVPRDKTTGVTLVEHPVVGRARLWQGRGFRMLHLPFVRGTRADGTLATGHSAQAEHMFCNAGAALAAFGFSYRQVVRTWIYIGRLLEWYGDFNRVRTAFYQPAGFGPPDGLPFPCSTGIQCRCDDEECMMDVLAVETTDPARCTAAAIQRSPRQDQSFNYGSAFSRGMTLDIEGRRTVHVSGTASINPAGESVHVGDAEMQSLETLMCIAAILEEQGGTLRNITSATLFCRDRASLDAWQRVCRLLQVPDFPKVCVRADVCRHDLLVEMEAVAVI